MAEKKEKKEKLGFVGEFKKFISRGSITDMAVGIIIGSAFTAIVNSLVNDILMPLLALVKKGGFTNMYVGLIEEGIAPEEGLELANGAIIEAGETTYRTYIYYGNFIQQVVNFLLIAFSLFMIVKIINRLRDASERARDRLEDLFDGKDNNEEPKTEETPK